MRTCGRSVVGWGLGPAHVDQSRGCSLRTKLWHPLHVPRELSYNSLRNALASAEHQALRAAVEAFSIANVATGSSPTRSELLCRAFDELTPQDDKHIVREEYCYQPTFFVEQVIDAAWWDWVRLGLAVPDLHSAHAGPGYTPVHIRQLRFTPPGIAVLGAAANVDPQPIGARFRDTLEGLADEPRARLEDAATCLAANVLRATVVLTGLAYEAVVHEVLHEVRPTGNPKKHADRVAALLKWAQSQPDCELRKKGLSAISEASLIADARNKAAHPGRDSFERADVEDYLRRAARHLRNLGNLRRLAGRS